MINFSMGRPTGNSQAALPDVIGGRLLETHGFQYLPTRETPVSRPLPWFNFLQTSPIDQPILQIDSSMGRPTGIEPIIAVPQTAVITTSLWPPYRPVSQGISNYLISNF